MSGQIHLDSVVYSKTEMPPRLMRVISMSGDDAVCEILKSKKRKSFKLDDLVLNNGRPMSVVF